MEPFLMNLRERSSTPLALAEGERTDRSWEESPYRLISPELDTQTADLIRSQAERILQSDAFLRSKRMQRFLSFAVDQALKGSSDSLNERSIARYVFDKKESFNPCLDPIVRIEVGRLRSKLRQYYAEEGGADVIRIAFRKRSYLPTFRLLEIGTCSMPTPCPACAPKAIAILPFADLNPKKGSDHFCDRLTEELTNLAGRATNLRVVARTSTFPFKGKLMDVRKIGTDLSVDVVLEGSVQREGRRIRISTALVNARNGYRLWSTTYDLNSKGGFNTQELLARKIADQLNKTLGGPRSPAAVFPKIKKQHNLPKQRNL